MNEVNKFQLVKEQETLLITLHAKALDSYSKASILHDIKAKEIIESLDYNFEKINGFGHYLMVIRAKQLDLWLVEFLKSHPNAIVLNLGCGLDTRVSRINPKSDVRWFDIDYPEVMHLRKQFYANHDGYEMIESSINELNWLDKIPKDKPTMIIAEGVLEYFTEDEVKALFERLINYFPEGQLAFDVMNTFAIESGKERLKETTGAEHKWAVDDLRHVDHLNSKFKRLATVSIIRSRYISKLPMKYRLIYTMMALFPNFRNMLRVLLYKF